MYQHALLVEPDAVWRGFVRAALADDNWQVSEAGTLDEALKVIDERCWALVFCDAQLSAQRIDSTSELTLLRELKGRCDPSTHIVVTVMAAHPHIIFDAVLNGASDYIRKPCREADIYEHSHRVAERLRAADNEKAHARGRADDFQFHAPHDEYALIGKSDPILQVFKELAKSLGSNHTSGKTSATGKHFLVTGETGTGKELVARLIHRHGGYRTGSFIAVNCSTLPAELADSELFGSSPGAFTGADRHEHHGLWEMANGGTLFLDEITEAPRAVMPKLLRVLQDGQVRRLGAKRWVETDVQVVAATNRNLAEEVKRGRFREDLYHRLSQHRIHLPPLRERLEDVPLLAAHFARLQSGGAVRFAQDALQLLTDFSRGYGWRGNVRELENVVRRAVAHAPDRTVYAVDLVPHLPPKDETHGSQSLKRDSAGDGDERADCVYGNGNRGGLDEQVRRFRNSVVKESLAAHNNNRSRAAKTLQVSRSTMHRLIDELEQECGLR